MIDLEALIEYERLVQGATYPLYLTVRDDEGRPVRLELGGIRYQWVHKLMDVKDGKPIYTTGLKKEEAER